jgi:hypothetical protein
MDEMSMESVCAITQSCSVECSMLDRSELGDDPPARYSLYF